MGSVNYGGQTLTYDYQASGVASGFNKINYQLHEPGIYEGGVLSVASVSQAEITPFTVFIHDDTNELGVRVQSSTTITHTVSEASPFIVGKMVWVDTAACYMDVENATSGEISSNPDWIVFGQCVFSTGDLTSFNLVTRTIPHKDILATSTNSVHGIQQGTGNNFDADKVDGADLDTNTSLGTSDIKVPSQNAVKVYADGVQTYTDEQITIVQGNIDTVESDLSTHEALDSSASLVHGILQGSGNGFDADTVDGAEKSIDGTLVTNSDNNIPTEQAVKTYVDATETSVLSYIDNTNHIPIGTIWEYDGGSWVDDSTLPGWYACIAENAAMGCPDLVSLFTIGCAVGDEATLSGNASHEVTIASANLPLHTHVINHGHTASSGNNSVAHTHTTDIGSHSHRTMFQDNTVGGTKVPINEESKGNVTYYDNYIETTTIGNKTSGDNSASHTHAITVDNFTGNSQNGAFANTALNIQPRAYTVIKIRKCS